MKVQSLPEVYDAFQWNGFLSDVEEMVTFGIPVIVIPQGWDSLLRRKHELDHSTGNALPDATAFLALWNVDQWLRIDREDWIVVIQGDFFIHPKDAYGTKFRKFRSYKEDTDDST